MTLKTAGKAGAKAKAPISSHPAFSGIVALWFAALLGLGSLVLPVVLLEKVVTATGIGALLPVAQPPLGVTARILIALATAALGVVAGLAVARKVAAAQIAGHHEPVRANSARPASAKRPISARDELGIGGLDEIDELERPAPIPGRRRPLAMSEAATLSDFFDHAPLPGDLQPADPAPEPEALDLAAFAEQDEPETSGPFGSATLSEPPSSATWHPVPQEDVPLAASSIDAPPEFPVEEPPVSTPLPTAFADPLTEPTELAEPAEPAEPAEAEADDRRPSVQSNADFATRPLGELGLVELVERFALSLQRRAETDDGALALPPLRAQRASAKAEEAAAPVLDAVLELPEPANEPVTHHFDTPPPASPAIPTALQPFAFDEEDEPADAVPLSDFTLSLDPDARPFARPAPVAEAAAADDSAQDPLEAADDSESADNEDAGYSSLLAMKRPLGAGREFVRIDDDDSDAVSEPVVVFPGQHRPAAPASDGPSREPISQIPPQEFRPFDVPAHDQRAAAQVHFATPAMPTTPAMKRADPADTERALRVALEKLQKMSGAA